VFCKGDATTAALLSYFEYWHNVKLEIQANARANKMPSDPGLLQFHSEKELIEGILKIATSRAKIKKGIDFLVNKEVISIHPNPKPRYGFDRTRHFLFHPHVINSWLADYMAEKPHDDSLSKNRQRLFKNERPLSENEPPLIKDRQPLSKNEQPLFESGQPLSKNERTIPEISTETSTEISTETSTETSTEITTTTTTAPENFSKMDGDSSTDKDRAVGKETGQGEKKAPPQDQGEPQKANATIEPPALESGNGADSGVCDLIFDFALKDFTPEQQQRAREMLKSVPKAAQQSVLDELNKALSGGAVRSLWAYFSTLIKRYNADEFTPTAELAAIRMESSDTCPYCKETGQIRFMSQDGSLTEPVSCKHGQQARAYIQSMKKEYGYDFVNESDVPKNRLTAKDCPYCDERGVLDLRNRHNGKFDVRPCSHNREKIKQFAREKDALIVSAKPGFEDPDTVEPEQSTTLPLSHKAVSDGQDILNPAPDFPAPSPKQSFQACSEEEEAALDEIAACPTDALDPDAAARLDEVMAQLTAHLSMQR